ncbi:MAG: ubiquinol-cytochrome c reductase iron-sulfur subunit [Acaryochloridaceae cyanobacterium SU_2_1]|nr:ubiquinol-cytochrome c reductase iron-sulfur subunit [Acaryochloridaceae cyanobacterium SU_2_1]
MNWVGVGGLASSLPLVLAACSETTDTASQTSSVEVPPPPPESIDFVEVGKVTDLENNKALVKENFAGAPLLVIRNPKDNSQLVAFKNECTHKQCPVEWKADQGELVCDCHGSKFKPDGTVVNGPATSPLATYTVKIDGDAVLVKAG